ncbi:MAG TPA: VWA domain-containing protein [Pyrinomonadaceae bacterium]
MKSIFEHGRFGRGLAWLLVAVLWCGGALTGYTRAQQRQQPPQGQTQKKTPAKPGQPEQDEVTLAQDEEIERVNTDLTAVLFTAVDKNKRFVTTLKQEDVRVLEDGVPQPIFTFQRETERPLSLAILIDTSQSQERTLPDEKNAAREFVDAIIRPNKDEVAIVSFTGDSTLEQGMTGSLQRIRRAIDHVDFVRPSGYVGGGVIVGTPPISGTNQQLAASTAIWDAIMATSTDVFQETSDKTRRAMILITDGVDTSSQYGRIPDAINAAIKADAVIYSVGIGDAYLYGVEEASLRKLSERTGGRAYFPKSEEDLRAAFAQIQQELRSQYLIAYSPTNKARDGQFRQVRIEINNPELRKENLRLTYRQGYFAKGGGGEAHTSTQKNKRP